jgi:hypothetical protein
VECWLEAEAKIPRHGVSPPFAVLRDWVDDRLGMTIRGRYVLARSRYRPLDI